MQEFEKQIIQLLLSKDEVNQDILVEIAKGCCDDPNEGMMKIANIIKQWWHRVIEPRWFAQIHGIKQDLYDFSFINKRVGLFLNIHLNYSQNLINDTYS